MPPSATPTSRALFSTRPGPRGGGGRLEGPPPSSNVGRPKCQSLLPFPECGEAPLPSLLVRHMRAHPPSSRAEVEKHAFFLCMHRRRPCGS